MKDDKKKILQDHKRMGKLLVPPFMATFNLQEINYINTVLPETIWLALINSCYGNAEGAEISLGIVKVTSEITGSNLLFSFLSSYESITKEQQHSVKSALRQRGLLTPAQTALQNLICTYPSCPLNFLVDQIAEGDRNIPEIKVLLNKLYDKRGTETTFMLVNVIYHLFALDRLKVTRDTSLARLPEVREYPSTEISRQIASAVRASINSMMQPPFFNSSSTWNYYFWNRGVELEPIKM